MYDKIIFSLATLPVEFVYRIFDELDDWSMLCSAQNICIRINTILNSYHRYQTLSTLNLGMNKIGDLGAQYLANALQQNKTLTTLIILASQIGDLGAEYLANALKQNKTLTTIDLHSNTDIGDQGAHHFANTLQENKILTTLNIGWNSVGVTGIEHFINVLRQNKIQWNELPRRPAYSKHIEGLSRNKLSF
ncbi:unnamed protein product [Adineta steineri]|uniref:F-box domain-containing protein n=1 Tax=Adineta steineri TaxID=433720 RepID=A0A818XM53_9BILA|nr:unnamed protein product [Adineta steineri]